MQSENQFEIVSNKQEVFNVENNPYWFPVH